ncbi:MAG: amino acid racemase [Cyanobacteria bacterium P01_G01_bin.39]
MTKLLGILGGMGPLASTEFLQTIYEFNFSDLEQDLPACILFSDPTFPDRTKAVTSGNDEILLEHLIKALSHLVQLGVSKIAISCITIHYFMPKIPIHLRKKVISLIDVIFKEVLTNQKRYLLLCTKGTCQGGIFQNHQLWSLASQYIELPDEEDQNLIHQLIYQIKIKNFDNSTLDYLKLLDTLTQKYQVEGMIAGCTEFHLITKYLIKSEQNNLNYNFIDPLLTIARDFQRLVNE